MSSSDAPAAAATSRASHSPFIGAKLRGGRDLRAVAVEPAACPSLTRGKYAYDFGDTAKMTPLVKMHTLGSAFVPSGFHAGGLRYHGMGPLVSHCVALDLVEPTAYTQLECFEAGVQFARTESIIPAPEANHAVKGAIVEALRWQGGGHEPRHPLQPLRARPFRHAGVHGLLRRKSRGRSLRRERGGHGAGGSARRWRELRRAWRSVTTFAPGALVSWCGTPGTRLVNSPQPDFAATNRAGIRAVRRQRR